MQSDSETDQVIAAYADGQDIRVIARRHGLTPAEVEHLVNEATQLPTERPAWRASRGNRVLLGVAVGWVAWFFAGLLGAEALPRFVLLAIVAAITYALASPSR